MLQGRMERLPYKHIGAKLGKTDLACRLHFHQMVMAKRTPSTPAGRSIVFLSSEHPPEVHRLAPANTSGALKLPSMHLQSPSKPVHAVSGQSTMHQLNEQSGHRRSISWSGTSTPIADSWHPTTPPYHSYRDRRATTPVDLGKLNNIYQEHAEDFWSTIAAKYSGHEHLTPSELELAFFSARVSERRDLPSIVLSSSNSPEVYEIDKDIGSNASETTISSSNRLSIVGKCSVEALLNHAY